MSDTEQKDASQPLKRALEIKLFSENCAQTSFVTEQVNDNEASRTAFFAISVFVLASLAVEGCCRT